MKKSYKTGVHMFHHNDMIQIEVCDHFRCLWECTSRLCYLLLKQFLLTWAQLSYLLLPNNDRRCSHVGGSQTPVHLSHLKGLLQHHLLGLAHSFRFNSGVRQHLRNGIPDKLWVADAAALGPSLETNWHLTNSMKCVPSAMIHYFVTFKWIYFEYPLCASPNVA